MKTFLEFYQHIPYLINSKIFHIGIFSFGWYALMYLVGFVTIFGLLLWRLRRGEGKISAEQLLDFLFFCFLGAIIGGRIGYVFFYNFSYYLSNPIAIISPFDGVTGKLVGIYGMSYHGGLIGAIIGGIILTKKYKLNFWILSDFIIPAIPAGYFFGRLGNFFNGELYGRATNCLCGMYFPDDDLKLLRYPSQLFEAFLEGVVLFLFFWSNRTKKKLEGKFLGMYFIGYASMRFLGEFFREPDVQIGFLFGGLTLGQIFSLIMFFGGMGILFWKKRKAVL